MAKSKFAEQADETPAELQRFNVIIDGQDRVILAKDKEDLDQQIAKIRVQ